MLLVVYDYETLSLIYKVLLNLFMSELEKGVMMRTTWRFPYGMEALCGSFYADKIVCACIEESNTAGFKFGVAFKENFAAKQILHDTYSTCTR